jgi:hypothetical protein
MAGLLVTARHLELDLCELLGRHANLRRKSSQVRVGMA